MFKPQQMHFGRSKHTCYIKCYLCLFFLLLLYAIDNQPLSCDDDEDDFFYDVLTSVLSTSFTCLYFFFKQS